ncbi:MAG: hypothetical protein F6K52_18525 [Moorea sp. SIO3H5]|nr:hypothetical protein [Moorena sp. SIO3H5]
MHCSLLPKIQNVLQAIDNCYRKHYLAAKQMTNSDQFDTRFNLLLTALERITQQIEQLGHRTDSNARAIEQTNQKIEQLGHRIDSNARAIEALTGTVSEFKRDRFRVYSLIADVAKAQADSAQSQSRMYSMMENLDERQEQLSQRQEQLSNRQGEIVEILKLLTQSN